MKLPEKSAVSKKTSMRRKLVFLTALCLVGCSLLFTYYSKNQKLILRYQQKIKDLKKQQQTLLKTRAANSQLEQSIKNLKRTLRSPGSTFTVHNTKQPAPQMIAIARKAQAAGLCLNSCIVQKRKRKNWFIKQNILYEAAGTREQIWQFIKKLQNDGYALRCKKLAVKKAADQKNINLSCTLQFLLFEPRQNTRS